MQKDCIVSKGTDKINEMLDHVLQFKGEAKKVINKTFNYNLYVLAHASCFASFVVLNNSPLGRTVVSLIKNGSDVVSFKISNSYVNQTRKLPQCVHFRCGKVHIIMSLKKIGKSYKLQQPLLKQEMNHDEFYEDTWEVKEHE